MNTYIYIFIYLLMQSCDLAWLLAFFTNTFLISFNVPFLASEMAICIKNNLSDHSKTARYSGTGKPAICMGMLSPDQETTWKSQCFCLCQGPA